MTGNLRAWVLVVPASLAAASPSWAGDGPAARSLELSEVMFYVLGAVTVVSCLGIVFSANIVRSAMWLFGTLGSVACLYFLLEANFLAAIQLIVYAGGILVLIIFGIMLTSKSPYVRLTPRRSEMIGGAAVCLLLFVLLVWVMTSVAWDQTAAEQGGVIPVAQLGKGLLTTYLAVFEAASVLLLVVMIGASYLVRSEKR